MSFTVIFSNIIGFDGIIIIAAVLNTVIFFCAKSASVKLYKSMHRCIYAPSYSEEMVEISSEYEGLTDHKVSEMREKAVRWYTLYVNITGIFPLLGILGTVISLLGMVGSEMSVSNGFFAALTSTLWGLVFAIIFKFLDGFISAKLEYGEHAAELFMQRRYDKKNHEVAGVCE